MTRRIVLSVLAVLILLGICSSAHARLMKSWDYKKLSAESDLIVIGIQAQPSEMTLNTIILPDIGPDEIKVNELITSFVVAGVLKGELGDKVIQLRHYALLSSEKTSLNGPGLVSFDPQQKYAYLLFLKKGADGVFEPMSGQTDPDQAVKKLDGVIYSEEYVSSLLNSQ